jgi:hypothetical protein
MISQRSNNAFSEKREEFRTPEATPISGFRNFIKHSPVVEKNKMTMKACAISKVDTEIAGVYLFVFRLLLRQ